MTEQPHAKTQKFSLHDDKNHEMQAILAAVYQALREKSERYPLDTDRQAQLVRPLYFDMLDEDQKEYAQKRLIRALEVKLISGKSILELQQNQPRELRHNDVRAFKLELSPEELNLKIAARTEVMLKEGWIDEAEKAISAGLLETPTAHQALGYKIIDRFLKGEFSREELKEKLIIATRQYARRQRTWFRHQHPEAEAITSPESPLPIFH